MYIITHVYIKPNTAMSCQWEVDHYLTINQLFQHFWVIIYYFIRSHITRKQSCFGDRLKINQTSFLAVQLHRAMVMILSKGNKKEEHANQRQNMGSVYNQSQNPQ